MTRHATTPTSQHVESFRHPEEFPPDLIGFVRTSEGGNIESTVAWFRNFQDAVHARHEGVRYYVLRRAGVPVALLPVLLARGSDNNGARQANALTNYYSALYTPLLAEGAGAEALVPILVRVRSDHRPLASLQFAPMDPESPGFRALLEALPRGGLVPFRFFCFGNWYLPVASAWPAYLAERKGVLRSTIKRAGKKFKDAGGRLELLEGAAAMERGLPAFLEVYARSWKVPEPYPAFVPGLASLCAERASLRLGVAWLNDTPIAAQLWITESGTASIYKLAYDEAYKALASGTLLTTAMMQHAFEHDRVTCVDYLIGDDAYKADWMSHRRERWGIVAYNPRSVRGLQGLLQETVRRLVKRLAPSRGRGAPTEAAAAPAAGDPAAG